MPSINKYLHFKNTKQYYYIYIEPIQAKFEGCGIYICDIHSFQTAIVYQ